MQEAVTPLVQLFLSFSAWSTRRRWIEEFNGDCNIIAQTVRCFAVAMQAGEPRQAAARAGCRSVIESTILDAHGIAVSVAVDELPSHGMVKPVVSFATVPDRSQSMLSMPDEMPRYAFHSILVGAAGTL